MVTLFCPPHSVHRVLTKSKCCHFAATGFYECQRMLGTARRPPNCVPSRRPKGRLLARSLSISLSRARRSHRPRPSVRPTIVRLVVGGAPLSLERGAAQSRLVGLFCLTAFTSAHKYSVSQVNDLLLWWTEPANDCSVEQIGRRSWTSLRSTFIVE